MLGGTGMHNEQGKGSMGASGQGATLSTLANYPKQKINRLV